jgi:endonuclease/exonuclease/phosphatase family metal-dependent hydrolase
MNTTTVGSSETTMRTRSLRVTHRPVVWLLTVCCIWSIVRLGGGDRIPLLAGLLVPILAFTPCAALLSLVLVVCAAALRRWVALGIAVAVACTFAVAVLPRAIGDTTPPANGPLLRVLTINLHFGNGEPRNLVNLVRRSRTDVLSLQEFTTQAAVALDRAGLGTLLPYKVIVPMRGAQGSALYARYPLRALPMTDIAIVGLAMPRAQVQVPDGGRVEITAVHLARPMNPAGVGQWARGFVHLPTSEPHGATRILAGDFNATLDHTPVRGLLDTGYVDAADATGSGLTPTFRRRLWPPITIDHVLVDARCAVRRTAVYGLPHSDHRALFAELRLP